MEDRTRALENQLDDEQQFGGMSRQVKELNEIIEEFKRHYPDSQLEELPLVEIRMQAWAKDLDDYHDFGGLQFFPPEEI